MTSSVGFNEGSTMTWKPGVTSVTFWHTDASPIHSRNAFKAHVNTPSSASCSNLLASMDVAASRWLESPSERLSGET